MGKFADLLLNWYGQHGRMLPWRSPDPSIQNPYHVWISEIMLQQTTVVTVIPYFNHFIRRWPTIQHLADSPLEEILHAWQGLGYYSRARNLHRCAQYLVANHGGILPTTEKDLIKLPGIGPYTASAIMTIAFQKPATVMDGNVIRVISRLLALPDHLPHLKSKVLKAAADLACQSTAQENPGDYAQALMDLGAIICTPKTPKCSICPVQTLCQSHKQGNPEKYPVASQKSERPFRHGTFFWIENSKGEVFIEQRPPKGLLGGMMGFPSIGWDKNQPSDEFQHLMHLTQETSLSIKHTFTHFHLKGNIRKGYAADESNLKGSWVYPKLFPTLAFPTLMKKVIDAVNRELKI